MVLNKQARNPGKVEKRIAKTDGTDGIDGIDGIERIDGIDGTDETVGTDGKIATDPMQSLPPVLLAILFHGFLCG